MTASRSAASSPTQRSTSRPGDSARRAPVFARPGLGRRRAAKGKKIVIFGLPGAFTPTCSAKHVPGYVAHLDQLKAKGVDEVWCVSVNDGFVMAAWGRDEKALGKVRFLGDGSADFAKKLGLDVDLTGHGMGTRMKRFSMFVDDLAMGKQPRNMSRGPGKFEVSNAETMLTQLG